MKRDSSCHTQHTTYLEVIANTALQHGLQGRVHHMRQHSLQLALLFKCKACQYFGNVIEALRLGRRRYKGEDINRGHLRLLARRHEHQRVVRIGQAGDARVNRLAHREKTGSSVVDIEGVHTDLHGVHLHGGVEAEQALIHVQPAR